MKILGLLNMLALTLVLGTEALAQTPPPYILGPFETVALQPEAQRYETGAYVSTGDWLNASISRNRSAYYGSAGVPLADYTSGKELFWIRFKAWSVVNGSHGSYCPTVMNISVLVDGKLQKQFTVYKDRVQEFAFFLDAPVPDAKSIWIYHADDGACELAVERESVSARIQNSSVGYAADTAEPSTVHKSLIKVVDHILGRQLNPPGQTKNLEKVKELSLELGKAKPNQMIFWATALYNHLDRLVPVLADQMAVGNQNIVDILRKNSVAVREYYGVGQPTHSIAAEMPSLIEQVMSLQTAVTPTGPDAEILLAFLLAAEDFNNDALTAGDAALGGAFADLLKVYIAKKVEPLLKKLASVEVVTTKTSANATLLQIKRLREFFNSFETK